MSDSRPSALPPGELTLVVIDIQEKLAGTMDAAELAAVCRNVGNLLELARLAGIRVLATEQYPKGLGPTCEQLSEGLEKVDAPRIDKLSFSAVACEAFSEALSGSKGRRVVLTGMESHVCVQMTAVDLVSDGWEVHVPHDAVISRDPRNKAMALEQMRAAGVNITSTETVLFRVLERSGTDTFRAISKLLR